MIRHSATLAWFRKHIRLPATALLLGSFSLWSVQVKGASLTWDGGSNTWDNGATLYWNSGNAWTNSFDNIALFGGAPGVVTLGAPISAGGLTFNSDGYRLTGNTLTLGAPTGSSSPLVAVNGLGTSTTISSVLAGTSGFTKTGNGTLHLGNSSNTLSGDISIKSGNLVITNAGQLGTGTTAISITGIANTGNPGFSGGSLVLAGPGTGSGITLNREVSVSGRGPGAANASGGLVSVGNNTIAGGLVLGAGASEGRAVATHGITTVSGGLYLGTGQANLLYGNGNWIVSGQVTGQEVANDRFIKTGNVVVTTLWLQNASNNFAESLRIDSGSVRVQAGGALGQSTTTQAVDFNGGMLEVRTDVPNTFATHNVNFRGNTSTILVDHDLTSSLINQTVAFGGLNNSATNGGISMSGRNGYNLSLGTGATMNWPTGGNFTVNNTGSSGALTINASISRASETTARTLSFTSSGEIILTGDILQVGTGAVALAKNNTGMLKLQGTSTSTATGATTINAGTLSFSSFNQLPTGQLNIGNATTTSGALNYTGAGEISSKTILLNTTTANAYINANGSGALTLSGSILTTVNGAKTLVLGGANMEDNAITSVYANSSGIHSLQKIGAGTWVLAGTANNTFTGSTTVSGGTLKLQEAAGDFDILPNAGAMIFNVDAFTQVAGGNLQYRGAASSASAETAGALTLTAGAGTLTLAPGAGGSTALTFASLAVPTVGTGLNVVAADGTVTLTGVATSTATTLPGNGRIYLNGADFARSSSGALVTPSYGTDAGFVVAGAALTAANHNLVSADTSTGALTVSSLKISGAQTVTQTGLLTINAGANTSGGILQTGGAGTITGTGVTTAGTGDLVIRVNGASDQLTMAAPITSTTTGGLTKNGSGLLLLQGAQAYTGATTINQGQITLDTGSRLGGATASNNNNLTIRQDGTLDINGNSIGIAAFNGAGLVTNTSSAATLTIGNNNQSGYFTGLITGNLGITKAGTGTGMSLTGLNTFTGPVTLSTGTLAVNNLANIGSASALGAGDATSDTTNAASLLFNGGTLLYQGANGVIYQNTQTPSVSTNRLFTLAGNGTIDSSGSFGAPTLSHVANNASLIFSNTAPVAFTGVGARTLTLQGDSIGDNRVNLQLIDNPNAGEALNITKTGGSLWILGNATNSYSGTTTISAGVLRGQDGASLPTTSNLFLNGGVFESTGAFPRQTLGSGAAEFRFVSSGNGGFSSSTSKFTVDLTSLGSPVWGSATDFINAGVLILNSTTSLADVEIAGGFGIIDGSAASVNATTTAGSSTINLTVGNTSTLTIGQTFTGNANIPAGSFITAINSATQFVISSGTGVLAATGAATTINAGGWREIQVNDNGTTNLDFATVSGVISGAGGLGKIGSGPLILGDSNTYSGNTVIRQESVFATSIGAAGATSSSFGTNVSGGILQLGNPSTTTTVNLMYVGPGETTTRQINLIGTTGTRRIDSSGSGALILTNLVNSSSVAVNTTTGARTLEIRGINTDGNMITSVLANDGANVLTISKQDGGFWILNPATPNTFTGSLTSGGGTLGLTSNGIGSASSVIISNAAILAYGAPLTTSTPVTLANNATAMFAGTNAITFNGNVTKAAGANDQTFSNNLEGGALLTINGNFVNLDTTAGTRNINIRGYGSTVWNGVIQNSATASVLTAWNIAIDPNASFTMTGGSANTYTGATTLTDGILILDKVGALGTGTFAFNGGTLRVGSSLANLTGANAITNLVAFNNTPPKVDGAKSIEFAGGVTMGGSRNIQNELTGGAQLIISSTVTNTASSTLSFFGSGNTLISGNVGTGTGTQGLQLFGPGALSLTATNLATGALTATRGIITLSGTSGGTWNAGTSTINAGGTLTLDNSGGNNAAERLNNTGAMTGNGGTLNLIGASGGSSETTGALTLNSVSSNITMSGGGPNVLTFASVNFANSGSSLDLTGVPGLGSTNKVKFTAAPTLIPASTGIAPRIFIGGNFASYDATNGVVAFSGYNNSNNLNTAAVTDTMNVTANASLTANRTLNALKINGTGLTVGGAAFNRLTLTSGGVLNTGGDNTISTAEVAFAGVTPLIQVDAGTTLTVSGSHTGSANWAKASGGTLELTAPSFISGTQNLLGGTLKLSGGLNTLFPNQLLQMNIGTTLDLNGNSQFMAQLTGPGGFPGTGGTIMSSTGTPTLVTNSNPSSTTFSGQIVGGINFVRIGGNTLTLEMAQTYTGPTTQLGGTLGLENDATILNTSAIVLNYAALSLNNNSSLQTSITDRVSDTAPITLRSGTITFNGRLTTAATETLGAVTAAAGASTISANTGGGTFGSADLTLASLTRSAGTTVNFTGTQLGQQGNNARIVFTTAPTVLGSGVLGAWAIANSTDYAAYNTGNGVGIVGQGGYTGYDGAFGSGNITELPGVVDTTTTLTGTTTTALLKLAGNVTNNIAFTSSGDVLNLELGGLLRSSNVFDTSIGTTATRGVLTAGGTETSGLRDLVVFNNATGNPTFTGGTINVTTSVVTMSSTVGLRPGMTITNGNFPAGTTIVSVDSINQVTLSQVSTNGTQQTSQTFTGGSYVTGVTTSGSAVVTMNSTVGVAPGMTFTGTNVPAGTYVVSVDGANQLTLSQNATANGSALTFTVGVSNTIINSVIADNGLGNSVSLVKSGAGILNLSANNTYTGGTIVSQGTVNLIGSGVVIPAGGVTLTGASMIMNTNVGQIDPTNAVTFNGSSTLTLAGSLGNNNTLDRLIFDNNGGTTAPTLTIPANSILTLTNASPITVTTSNALTVPIISGGILALGAGANTFNIGAIQVDGTIYTRITPSLNITSVITGLTSSITKSGDGILQLSAQSTFNGLNVTGGGILISGNSTGTLGGNGLLSGPLGIGAVTAASGVRFLVDGSRTIANDIAFAGSPIFDATATSVWTLTLNGSLTGAGLGATPTVNINSPFLTVALLGSLPAMTSITKTGLGTLIFNATNYTGDFNATALGNPSAVSLLTDGDGTGSVQSLLTTSNVTFDAGIIPTITVGRAGGTLPYNLAANKLIAPASVSSIAGGLTLTNNNGYGLQVSDAAALTGTPTFFVNTATASNVTQGLYLTGVLSGTSFNKTGGGTLALSHAGNTFTGNININQGVLSVDSDGALGNSANLVRLSPTTGTSTFRATDNITTSHTIQLSTAANLRAIEVVLGKTLQLDTAFDVSLAATAALIKADRGTLVLNASNSGWSGLLTINGGVVSPTAAANLGTGAISINSPGASLALSGGLTITNTITIDNTANNLTLTGTNTGGAIQSVSGANIISNAVTLIGAPSADNTSRNYGFGAASGASLSLPNINLNHATGGTNRNIILYFGGAGNINLTSVLDNTNGTPGNSFLFKFGDGSLNLTAANAIPDTEIRIYRGELNLSGAATLATGGTQVQAWQNGTINFDNSVTNTANRVSNRIVQIGGGTLNYIPNAAGTTQTSTGALQISQGANTINLGSGGNLTVTFASLTQNAGATLNLTGTFGTASNKLTFTTAPALLPATTGLLARVTTNGNEFATYSAANGIGTFTGYAAATNILSASATQTFRATPTTANSLTGNQTLNALTLSSGAGSVNVGGLAGLNPTTLTLTSGGILANGTGTGSTLSVPVVALNGVEGIVHVASGQTLDVTSGFSGTGGMTKSLDGTLNFNAQQFVSGNTIVNGGTLNLNSGVTNTLLFNNGLGINVGATVDLKNSTQFVSSLFSANGGGNTDLGGGTLTNSGAEATFVTNTNTNFNGQITGTIYLNKTGTGALNLQNANTYSGATLLNGGTTTLQDLGTLSNTTAITISRANLSLSNGSLYNLTDRVNDAAPLTLLGASISLNGRQQDDISESLGAVTLVEGHNSIFPSLAGSGINTVTLNLGGLSRSVGSTATLRFNSLGSIGLIGSTPRVMVAGGITLTNNLIGPWAIVDREYATYTDAFGVTALGQAGAPNYAGSGLNSLPLATDNVRHTTVGTTVLNGNTTVGTLAFGQQNGTTTLDLNGNTLTLQGGGLLLGQGTDNVNFAITNGTLTGPSGGGDLYITHANFSGTNRTVSIDAIIADNGGPVRIIKSSGDTGTSVMTWNGLNTYTGGTVLNQGTLVIGATGHLGTGGIIVHQAALTQTAGGIIPSQALTMNGSSTVTLAGINSLTGITFNSNGGSAPTLNPTGTLTLTGGITSTPTAAGAIAIIANGTLNLNAAGSYSINVAATLVNGQDVAPWQAGLIINSIIDNGGISKSGAGVLQLGGQSTFTGGINVTAGGLVIGASSTPAGLFDTVISGPLGTGAVTMAANTTLVSTAANTVSNNFTFLGDTVFNGVQNLTLNGITTLPSIWNATVTAPQMTVTIGDASPSLATDSINKSGLGILVVGNYAGTISATGGLVFTGDGNTLSTVENISLGGGLVITGDTAITINRSGSAPNARNKILQKTTLTVPGNIMSVSNQNGYGLEFTGTTTLTGPSHFAVGIASGSNVVQGLILTGQVSDGGGNVSLTKSGLGTLVFSNATNNFGGAGSTIDILNGILSVQNDGALGNALNTITLDVDGSTGVGFRATDTFSTARTIVLNQMNNAIEVVQGKTLTLTSAFSVPTATNTLFKNDSGVLAINADNTGWTGGITINGGAVLLSNASGAGSGTITISPLVAATGAALQLSGGISISNLISLQGVNNVAQGGINFGGQLQSVSGANTVTGQVRMDFDAAIGADSGATLDINGGINNPTTSGRALLFTGAGTINVNSSLTAATATANQYFAVQKYGTGTLNFTTAQTVVPTNNLTYFAGTTNFGGAGTLTGGNTIAATVNGTATLALDNSVTNVSNRLGGRALTLVGGNFSYTGIASGASTETLGVLTINRPGTTITANAGAGGTSVLTFASLAFGGDSAGNFVGTNLGTTSNKILFTTAPTLSPVTTGILARATVNSADFATYGANGIAAFTAYQNSNNPNTAAATDTMNLTASANLTANRTLNAIKLNGTGLTLGGAAFNALTLTSGGILNTGGSNTISAPVLQFSTAQAIYHVNTSSTLEITSVIAGSAGWVKNGAGTLILSPPTASIDNRSGNTITGNATILDGKVVLNGGNNTLVANQFMILGPTGTLDLNGNSQMVRGLFTDYGVENGGGIVTGGALASSTLVMNNDTGNRSWSGQLTGALSFLRTGDGTMPIYSNNDYTGKTLIAGGTTQLRDGGRLSATSDIEVTYSTLSIDNNGGVNDLTDRVSDSAPITLRGATLAFTGRAQTISSETVGDVTIRRGMSTITSTVGGTGVSSAELTLNSLAKDGGNGATLLFSSNLGLIGSSARVIVNTLNGNANANTTVGAGLTNNIIGGWAITANNEFASYIPGLGVASLNQTGALQYDLNNTFAGAITSDNVRLTSTTTIPSGGKTVNAVTMTGSNIALNFTVGSDILNLVSGGLIGPNNNQTIGTTVTRGVLTAGGNASSGMSNLYLYNRANTLTVNSQIVDTATALGSGTANVRLVLTASGGAITLGNGSSSYTGGTVVNGGTVNLSATTGSIVISAAADPADGLVINGGTVTMLNTAGQIHPSNIVTINGASVLNLFGNNTLAGLIFRDDGGGSGATAVSSLSGTLTIEGNVVSTTANVASTSILNGRVDFGTTQRTLDISATNFNNQELAALLSDFNLQGITGSSGGIIKMGDGVLQFNGQDNYTGATLVNEGRIQVGATNGGSRFSAYNLTTTSTALNLNGLSTILGSLEGVGQVTNSSTTAGTLTVGFKGSSTIFDGAFNRFNDTTVAAINLTKIGAGTLTLTSNASTSTGTLTVNRGTVVYKDAGVRNFISATAINEGGTLTLDNTGTVNVNNRLGGTGALNLNGGVFNVLGRDVTATTELAGVLTLGASASAINLTAGASGGTVVVTFASLSQSAGGTAVVSGTNLGTDTILKFTTAPTLSPATTGILARIAVGTDFATYNATNGVIAFTGYATPTDINAAAATATIKVDATTTVRELNLARTINALNIIDNGVTLSAINTLLPTQGWTVTSGGVLVNGNSATISAPVLSLGAEGIFRVNGSSLTVSSTILGTAGITKTGSGSMTLSSLQSYTGQTALNLGNLTLAGGDNTLLVAPTGTIPTVADLQVNGGLLDLNGNNQAVRTLLDSNTLAFIAGEITNSSGTAVTLTTAMNTNSTFGGKLSGNFALTRSGNNTLTLVDAMTYTGATIIRGGAITLQDTASLATSSITLNFGALTLNNNNLNPLAALNPVRFAASTPVTMQGGTLVFTPGGSVDNTSTINSVTILGGGANTITPNGVTGGTNTINIGNLVLPANTGTTLHFNTDPGQPTSGGAQVFLTQLNGVTPTNNAFLGSNVIINNGEWGVYNTIQGVIRYGGSALTGNTVPAYAAALASGNNLPANVSNTGADVTLTANTTIGALRLTGAATRNILFTSGSEVLNLALGGILRSNEAFATNFGTTALRGVLTSGGTATTGITELVTWHNQNTITITINSIIADNGLGNLTRLVKSGPAGLTLTAANTYTGGTVVDQGTLTINATAGAGTVVIPAGGITLNNANLTMSTNQGQIASSNDVTINGSGVLTLVGSNTLNSVTFNNTGGNATPSVAAGTQLVFTSVTPITASNDNYSFTPTLSGTEVNVVDGAAISTSGLSPVNLIISAKITTAGATTPLVKTGTGSLVLSSTTSAFANGFNLDQGSLIFAASSAGTPPAVTAGPIGTGTLSLANGVAILSDGTARTIGNAVSVAGNFTIGTPDLASSRGNAGNSLTLNGDVTLAAGAHTITVGGVLVTGTISGKLTGGTSLAKDGLGTLVLSKTTNDYGGATSVNAGTLQLGAAGVIPDGSAVTVASGGFLNVNGFAETIGSLAGAGIVTNSGAAVALTLGFDDTSAIFSGILANGTNALNLIKLGVGTQTLSGANTYTGTTTINAGILSIAHASALGAATASTTVSSGGSLELQGGITVVTEALSITGDGSASSGALRNLSGDNTYGGVITIGTGGARLQSDAGTLFVSNTIAATTQPVTFAGAGNINVTGNLTGTTATLTKVDAGTLILGGTNTYTGGSNLNGGVLQVDSLDALGSTGTIAFGGGILRLTATNATDYSNRFSTSAGQQVRIDTNSQSVTFATDLTSVGGTLEKLGAGTLTLTGNNTYSGGTVLTEGVLAVANSLASSTGSGPVTVNGGTLTGGGLIAGDTTITSSGVLNPGAVGAVGTLTLDGNLTVDTAGSPTTRLVFDISSATGNEPGLSPASWASYSGPLLTGNNPLGTIILNGNNDLLNMTGAGIAPTFNGNGTIATNMLTGYTWIQGDILNLFDWMGLVATASNGFNPANSSDLDLPSLGGGLAWDTSRFLSTGAIAVVPEPSRALLLLFGLLSLGLRRRRHITAK